MRSPEGKAIFRKRPLQNLSKDDEEMKSLDMLYRRKVEFAVGHNISVHAVASEGELRTGDRGENGVDSAFRGSCHGSARGF